MITLASDFGSPYPAAMRGVLCARSDARLVDVAHDLPRQDVRAAAFWLREVLPYFPPAVHLAVVDPGMGTERAALVVRAGGHALVGPDNGALLPPARRLAAGTDGGANGPADDGAVEVFEWNYEAPGSHTFHGRDVFAPAAAAVHEAGVDALETLEAVTPIETYESLSFPAATVEADGATGEVVVVDGFGNVVTNVPESALEGSMGGRATVNGERVPVRRTYADVAPGERLLTVGSHGNVECAVNRGRGDEAFGLAPGDSVALEW